MARDPWRCLGFHGDEKIREARGQNVAMIQYSTEAGPIGQQGVQELVVRKTADRSLPMTLVVLGVTAIVITAAWIALLGYGAWVLIDWITG